MRYQVTGFNNFVRVFEIPETLPKEYCFHGGISTSFKMVDWFNPVPNVPQWSIPEKKYNILVASGEIKKSEDHEKIIDSDELQRELIAFISPKNYIKTGRSYLCICDFGLAFMFSQF